MHSNVAMIKQPYQYSGYR